MRGILNFIIDLLFPPSPETLKLRTFTPQEISSKLPIASYTSHPFITSLFTYKNPLVKELIWNIKYKKDKHSIELGGYALYTWLQENIPTALLVPIPISKERRKERGYNQCEVLIKVIEKLDSEKKYSIDFNILKRVRHLDRQTLKTRKERLQDTDHIFSALKKPLTQPIIIIDDVATTGSTLREARETLLSVGYTDVRALTLAH